MSAFSFWLGQMASSSAQYLLGRDCVLSMEHIVPDPVEADVEVFFQYVTSSSLSLSSGGKSCLAQAGFTLWVFGDVSLGNLFFGGRGTWRTGLGMFGVSMNSGWGLCGRMYLFPPADVGLMSGSNAASPWASAMSLSGCLLNMPDWDFGLAGVGERCPRMAF